MQLKREWLEVPTPAYVVEKALLEKNLQILAQLEKDTGCHVLLAQKAFSMYYFYPFVQQYISGAAASGLFEARLAHEEMKGENHVFSPAYREEDFAEIVSICDHRFFSFPA